MLHLHQQETQQTLVIMVEQEVLEDVDLQLVQYGVVVRQALLVLM